MHAGVRHQPAATALSCVSVVIRRFGEKLPTLRLVQRLSCFRTVLSRVLCVRCLCGPPGCLQSVVTFTTRQALLAGIGL